MLGRLRNLNARLAPGHFMFGPTNIILGVNNFCNLRCLMCDVGTGNDETNFGANLVGAKSKSMPLDLFHKIADQTAAFWPKAHLSFVYTEPLAWTPLGDALIYARDRGLRTSVTANRLMLSRRAEEIAAGNCRDISISLDGTEAVHNKIRRHPNSYAKAVSGLEMLAA